MSPRGLIHIKPKSQSENNQGWIPRKEKEIEINFALDLGFLLNG